MDALGDFTVARTEGDSGHWEIEVRGYPKAASADFMKQLEDTLTRAHWTMVSATSAAGRANSARTSRWQFTGSDGKTWTGALTVSGSDATGAEVTTELVVRRAEQE